ncbi:MAG: queuosine precursor transporter [Anaerolineaceae bacterium]|nr:queuosine precursor transporter [Anaerolineaceae bacterium]
MSNKYSIWFVSIAGLFITSLITANIAAVKLVDIWGFIMPAGIVIFPISYIVGDILTEVYGFRNARRVIWLGFFCNLVAVAGIVAGQLLPSANFWDGQAAYERILGYTPRLLFASFIAYLIGEFLNAYILDRMKKLTKGRWLWSRTITSTVVGQGFDSLIFIVIAFAGTMATNDLVLAVITQWLFKTLYESLATPLTYLTVNFIKRQEGIDAINANTQLNPLITTD